MRIESKLCHLTENKAVVHVCGWLNEINLGSALAEGPTVEVAEDRAISRLNERLKFLKTDEKNIMSINEDQKNKTLKVELPKSEKNIINHEPNDWSNELNAIDSEIERLKWSRDDEVNFLEKNLGYSNRNKITNYNDILKYLSLLKQIELSKPTSYNKSKFDTLIDESDRLLKELSWDNVQGRHYLQKEFNVSTRKQLDQEQLISFIAKLKSIRNQYLPG